MNEQISHYRLLGRLGAGGMGEVFLAEDTHLERRVALKLLPIEVTAEASSRRRFLTEARAASALNHPNVCTVFEVGETDDGRPFIAMELVEGKTLDVLLEGRPLEIPQIVDIGTQLADAFDAAHQKGIVHRDIKPSNISVGDRNRVKVLDFGLAKRLGTDEDSGRQPLDVTAPGDILGTPVYMSPEQARGKAVDHRTDIFSLGVVFYELATGRPPFDGSTFGELVEKIVSRTPAAIARFNYDVPPELERIILKCLQKDPERRYQTPRELHIDFENLGAELRGAGGRQMEVTREETIVGAPGGDLDDVTLDNPSLARLLGQPTGSSSSTPSMAAPPSADLHVEPCDVIINCAQADDKPLKPGRPGWVSRLKRGLELRMEQLSGETISVGAYPVETGKAELNESVQNLLPSVRAMVSVVSPPFVKTEACRRKLELFWQEAQKRGGLGADELPPVLKAVKMPVSPRDVPPGLTALLSRLVDIQFFEEDVETGRLREFDEPFGPEAEQRFFEKVYDLAFELCRVLRTEDVPALRRAANGGGGKTIYLAETTSDLRTEREQVRRELLERGYGVLPEAPLPTVAEELEATIRGLLASSDLSVHLIGERYGLIPEEGRESFVELQVRLTAEVSSVPRIIWLPAELQPGDERQRDFVRRVREDPELVRGAEIVHESVNELKDLVEYKLAVPATKPKTVETSALAHLYLICDAADEEAVEPLESYLFDQGLEVATPDFEAEEAEAAEAHIENLRECDAVIIYYGSVRKSWVETKLRELLKANGYGRSRPIVAQSVYMAPPVDARKKRFRTHAAGLIVQENGFTETSELRALVQQIREGVARTSDGSENEPAA